jgi:hypothetical protein
MRTKDVTPETVKELNDLIEKQRHIYLNSVGVYIKRAELVLLFFVIAMISITIYFNI